MCILMRLVWVGSQGARWARAGFRQYCLIVGVWHHLYTLHANRNPPPRVIECVSMCETGRRGGPPFTDGLHRRTVGIVGQAG